MLDTNYDIFKVDAYPDADFSGMYELFCIGTYIVHTRISDVDIHFIIFLVEHVDKINPL